MARLKLTDEELLRDYVREDRKVATVDEGEREECASCGRRIKLGETLRLWRKKSATYNTPPSRLIGVLCENDDDRLR